MFCLLSPEEIRYFACENSVIAVHLSRTRCAMSAAEQNSDFDLSVIITCRNSLSMLPQCVGALHPLMLMGELRLEILVVDMGSDDGTTDYLEAEKNRWHISDYVSYAFENRFEAMNRGLKLAKGRACLFITPETELMIENTYACCENILKGKAASVFSTAVQVDSRTGIHRPQTPDAEHLFLRNLCNLAAFFCDSSLLRRLGGFDWSRYPSLADFDLMHRILETALPYRVVPLSSCRQYSQVRPDDDEQIHVDFLRFIALHREEILMRCREHPSYAVRTVHEILRHAVRCDWPVESDTLLGIDALLRELGKVLRPIVRKKITKRLYRRALAQAVFIPFKGLRRARITLKLCRSHLHVARLLNNGA